MECPDHVLTCMNILASAGSCLWMSGALKILSRYNQLRWQVSHSSWWVEKAKSNVIIIIMMITNQISMEYWTIKLFYSILFYNNIGHLCCQFLHQYTQLCITTSQHYHYPCFSLAGYGCPGIFRNALYNPSRYPLLHLGQKNYYRQSS